MDYLKQAIIGTRNHHEVLHHFGIEAFKHKGGYVPPITQSEDDKIQVTSIYQRVVFGYFTNVVKDKYIVAIFTDLCPTCANNCQKILNQHYGEKCPYKLLAISDCKCGHIKPAYFATNYADYVLQMDTRS